MIIYFLSLIVFLVLVRDMVGLLLMLRYYARDDLQILQIFDIHRTSRKRFGRSHPIPSRVTCAMIGYYQKRP